MLVRLVNDVGRTFSSHISSSSSSVLWLPIQKTALLVAVPPRSHLFSSSTASTPSSTGSGIVQRISSFLVGAGLMAVVTQYYIYQEVHNGNQLMLLKQRDLEQRLSQLEKK